MLWDNHMHSNFSGDSDSAPMDMIRAARAAGLRGMTFTDHLDLDYPAEYGFFDLDLENYYPSQHSLAQAQSDDSFTVLTGIELGLQPHVAAQYYDIVQAHDYDFVIGSTHLVDGHDPYFDSFWDNVDTDSLLKRCYQVILENIKAFTDFDAVGHLDYVFRYVKDPAIKANTYRPYQEQVDAILEYIIKNDKALEVNTGGIRKGMPYPNPCADIIKRYHDMGGRLITLGADAHVPTDVAADFDILPDLLEECGFKEFVVYKKRKPEFYPIR